ncbi:MAG: FtsX-like permease family protein [Ectothiorhodospiraceae bacterium]|nr:FtsX-like permease family protein [Ectothiorhodospiraceae bacterium]
MNGFRYALRLLLRDWRAGELRLLALALVLAVTAITAVAWLADRVALATEGRAAELLGGDRALAASDPIPDHFAEQARELGLQAARTVRFPSVVLTEERTSLTAVRAVDPGYPLRGALQVGDDPDGPRQETDDIPARGELWVEPRLLIQLDIGLGDQLELGAEVFTVSRVLFLEPSAGGGFQNLAPRVMMNLEDLAATGLVQQGSRVTYELLVAGDAGAVGQWQNQVRPELGETISLEAPGEGQPAVQQVMDAAKRFLGLSALLTVVVGGVAMLLTIRHYAARHLDRVAVMRCLGATERQIAVMLTWKMVLLGLFTAVAGSALGYGVHLLMLGLLADLLPSLPPPSVRPALVGVFSAQVILLGFALPTILRLRRVPPLRVLRRDLGDNLFRGWGVYPVALAAIFLLMWWQAGELVLALYVFLAVLGTLAVLALGAGVIILLLRRTRKTRGAVSLLLSGIARRPWTNTIQIMALGLGLMALLLLSVVRQDLLATWQDRVPPDAANYFLINIQPEEAGPLGELLADQGLDTQVYPMVRGRLVGINEHRVRPSDYPEARTQRLVAREFNLSWVDELPQDNRLVAGDWWNGDGESEPQFSMELEIAERLGVDVGDTLHFEAGGERYSARITSLREVQWDSFNVNFFVVSPPGLLDDAPATFITSFYLPPERQDLLVRLVREFPSVTLIDVNSILDTVRNIMEQGTRVVELMALLTLLSGLVVLLAALQVTREERQFESALLRSLGGRRQLIRRLATTEFVLLGGAAGLLAGVGAAVAGYVMANALFELDYAFNPWLVLIGVISGAVVVTLAGLLATRRLYRVSPMRLLKGAEEG